MAEHRDGDQTPDVLVLDASNLSAEALQGLIEEFVTRDGTDYGRREAALKEKTNEVRRQLESGEVSIVFDRDQERANLVPTRDLGSSFE